MRSFNITPYIDIHCGDNVPEWWTCELLQFSCEQENYYRCRCYSWITWIFFWIAQKNMGKNLAALASPFETRPIKYKHWKKYDSKCTCVCGKLLWWIEVISYQMYVSMNDGPCESCQVKLFVTLVVCSL